MKTALPPKNRSVRLAGAPRRVPLAAAALGSLLVSSTALAVDVDSAVYDADDSELIIVGVDLRDVDDVTITDPRGRETSLTYTYTRERQPRIVATLPYRHPGTYRLRVYTNTVVQDAMDVSVPSIAGSVSREAITRRTQSMTCLTTKCSLNVRCPNGYRAISGGFRKLTFNTGLIAIDASYPLGADRWRVEFRKSNSSTYQIALEAHAVCLRQN